MLLADVLDRGHAALRRDPARGHADEDPRIAARAHVEDLVGELTLLGDEVRDQRRHEVRIEGVRHRPEQLLREARLRDRRDHVALDVVLGALDGEHVREPDQAHLGGAVVALAEVAEDAGAGGREHDPAVVVLLHHAEGGLRDVERALQVHVEHDAEILGLELREGLVAQDAGVVDDDVDLAEVVDRGLHDRGAALGRRDGVVVGDGLAAGLVDLLHDLIGHARAGAGAVGACRRGRSPPRSRRARRASARRSCRDRRPRR